MKLFERLFLIVEITTASCVFDKYVILGLPQVPVYGPMQGSPITFPLELFLNQEVKSTLADIDMPLIAKKQFPLNLFSFLNGKNMFYKEYLYSHNLLCKSCTLFETKHLY